MIHQRGLGFYSLSYLITFTVSLFYLLIFGLFLAFGLWSLVKYQSLFSDLEVIGLSVVTFLKVQLSVAPLSFLLAGALFTHQNKALARFVLQVLKRLALLPLLLLGIFAFSMVRWFGGDPLFWVIALFSAPHLVRGWLSDFQKLPHSTILAGRALGMTEIQLFQKVIVPLCFRSCFRHFVLVLGVALGACAPVAYLTQEGYLSLYSPSLGQNWLPVHWIQTAVRAEGDSGALWGLFALVSLLCFFVTALNHDQFSGRQKIKGARVNRGGGYA